MSDTPAFPLEVTGIIIDILGDEQDLDTLKACSLTCRAFVPLSRKHIFSTLEIDTDYDVASRRPLERLLSISDPVVFDSIRKISIRVTLYHPECPSLPTFLLKITKLKSLFLCACGRMSTANWSKLSEAIRRALLHLMHLPTLTHLRLLMFFKNFPVSGIVSCNSLIGLDTEGVLLEIDHLPTTSRTHMIQEYTMQMNSNTTRGLLSTKLANGDPAFDFTMLRKLTLTCGGDHGVSATHHLLERVKHLEVLKYRVCAREHFRHLASLTARSARTLKILDLEAYPGRNSRFGPISSAADPSPFILGLCKELEEMSDRNVVETIKLKIDASLGWPGDAWENLDIVLTKSGWSKLKHVSITLNIVCWPWRRNEEALQTALDTLPKTQLIRLAKSNTVDFKITGRLKYY
ncbi:hypothetical protein B0H34DRAFT_802090 [Crassisporium funariophilum]|nr:hypothetical protein B0H34DRAFT_802090 [Crassisporium funariophilum]